MTSLKSTKTHYVSYWKYTMLLIIFSIETAGVTGFNGGPESVSQDVIHIPGISQVLGT